MSVFASPGDADRMYDPEVALAKTAVLYADHVDLYSVAATMHLGIASELESSSSSDIFELALVASQNNESVNPDEMRPAMEFLQTYGDNPNAPKALRRLKREWEAQARETRRESQRVIKEQFLEAGGGPLLDAMNAGRLTVAPIMTEPPGDDYNNAFIEAFVDRLRDVMTGTRHSYPLMTAQVRDLLQAAIAEGNIRVSEQTRTRVQRAGLAAGLIDRLPTFPAADMSEVLDIRKTLDGPLMRFRSEVAELAPRIESAPGSDDFGVEVEDLWISTVAPAIREIEERVESDSFLKQLTRSPDAATATWSAATGVATGLGITFGQTQGLINVGAQGVTGLVAGAAATLAPAALQAVRDAMTSRDERPQMRFFFLHDVNERLR